MRFQNIWKKSKKMLAFLLAVTLFLSGWGNYDFSVQASGELVVKLNTDKLKVVYSGQEIKLPKIASVKDESSDIKEYSSQWTFKKDGSDEIVVVDGISVKDAGIYTLTVKELEDNRFTESGTGEASKVETGRDGVASFVVEKLDFNECNVLTEDVTFIGTEVKPQKVVVLNKNGEEVSKDLYSLTYDNNINVGEASVTAKAVNGNPNVTGEKKAAFKINPLDLRSCDVKLDQESAEYTGAAIEPSVTITFNGNVIDEALYQVSYENNVNAGQATAIVKPVEGNNNVTGSATKKYAIEAKKLEADMVEITPDKETVTGDNFEDVVTVLVKDTVNGVETELTEGVDFEVDRPEMVKGGVYTFEVSGKGNYTGAIEKIFNLNYAQDGSAVLSDNTLTASVYADYVTVIPAIGYSISESVDGTFADSITYTAEPDDFIVYVQNLENHEITEFTLPAFTIDAEAPTLTVTGLETNSVWTPSKDITVDADGADYGVFYTTEKQDLVSPINQAPTGMETVNGDRITIAEDIYEDTTYYFYAIDNAGHVTVAEAVVNQIDTAKPVISISGNNENLVDGVYWKNANDFKFTVNVEDQENISGLKEITVTDAEGQVMTGLDCEFEEGALNAEGTFTITEPGIYKFNAVDVAGNAADVITIEVKEDTLAPEIVLAEPTGADRYKENDEYWFSADAVDIPFTVVDDFGTDEVEKAVYTVIYAEDAGFTNSKEVEVNADAATVSVVLAAGNAGKTTYYFKVADKAGNHGEIQKVTVGYDNTQPEIKEVILTQLNGDEWINFEESGAAQPNAAKVAFSVTAADAESGIQKIQYRSGSDVKWQDAVYTENDGVYTFVTNEIYGDGIDYVWEVRVANNVTPDMENAAAKVAENGKIDTTAPSEKAYIRFISDVKGANETFAEDSEGNWSSEIYDMMKHTWNKIWAKETVKFEVYVQDVTSGIDTISMSYNGKELTGLNRVDGVQAFTTGDNEVIGEDKNYIVFEGSITHAVNDELAIKNFRIDTLTDKAGNTRSAIVLADAENEDIIYLDNVAPKLVSVQIDEVDVVTDARYLYKETKSVVLTVEERFFAQENNPVYPEVKLSGRNFEGAFQDVSKSYTWENVQGTTQWYTVIELPLVAGEEMEYQLEMTYDDPSGNSLATDSILGVESGKFVSKIFAIDDVAPELVSYSVTGTGCYVENASVLKNDDASDDLTVSFTIDENPTYYEKSQENLIVKLYKEGELIKTLQDGVDGADALTKFVDGRKHSYSFTYDGDASTQDKFYVTVEYKNVVGHFMEDANDVVTPGTVENGMYTSESYIIDHIAPVFAIDYSEASNVVKDDEGELKGVAPLKGYKAYYNKDITATLTFDEKYFNTDSNNALEHFEIAVTKDGVSIESPEITWTHEENVHKAEFTISALADHSNDGNYQIEVKYRDCAENWMDVSEASDSNESSEDGTYQSPILVMDTTAPVVTTSYASKPAQILGENEEQRDYFSAETTFTIEVLDRSIRYQELKDVLAGATAVDVDGDKVDTKLIEAIGGIAGNTVMNIDGNTDPYSWILNLPLSTEANYDIPVGYTDLAGNTAVVCYKAQDESGNETVNDCESYTEKVTVDKQILAENIFVKFTGDINGANILSTMKEETEGGSWVSNIFRFLSNAWMKLWGNKEIKFDIYLRDEISGIHTITMQYLNDDGDVVSCELTKADEDIELTVDAENMASKDENGEAYTVYSGSIVVSEDTDLSVSQFKITEVTDKSTNKLENVTFVDKIYLDDVNPEISIEIQDKEDESKVSTDVVTKERYFYDKSQKMVLTIDERFFGAEDNPVYPVYSLTKEKTDINGNSKWEKITKPTEAADWEKVDAQEGNPYTFTIPLDCEEGYEVEYQVELSYADPAENKLVNGEGVVGVDNGTFTSKIFVIDDIAPELVDYSVVTTACDVQGASVLKNIDSDDLTVNFTINDNPVYYAETDNHAYSQENLIVKLYKEGECIKTLQHTDDDLTKSVTGRNHTYSFVYDGDSTTQDKFYVTVEYKDVVEHSLTDDKDVVTPGTVENGMYTSESYIIDHVNPKFDIEYSDATNVVEGARYHDTGKHVADEKSPLKGYTAYYNKDITVTLTFDEKYYNTDDNGKLEHFAIALTKDGAPIETPEITWTHEGTVHKAEFTIQALENHENDGDYQFAVKYRDCAENWMDGTAASASNESAAVGTYHSPMLVMDTTAPVLTDVAYDTMDAFNTVKGKDYVNAETTMTFTLEEHNPTATSAYSLTSLEGNNNVTWVETASNEDSDDIRETWLTVPMLGDKGDEQTVSIEIVDWAGNNAVLANDDVRRSADNTTFENGTYTDKFTVDTVAPIIKLEYITYTPEGPQGYVLRVPDRQGIETIVQSASMLVDYFRDPITVKVTVDEHNFDQSLFDQSVIATGAVLSYDESDEWSSSGDIHVRTFTFNADNQYNLTVGGMDNAKNKLALQDTSDMSEKLDEVNSKVELSVAVDNTIPAIGDREKPVVVIKPAKAQNTTKETKPQALYNSDVTYEVVVYDPLVNGYASGIQEIQFKVTGEDGTSAYCTVAKDGTITNGTGVTVKRVGGNVSNLARGEDNMYTFNVTISSKTFNTNGIELWVGAEDVSTRKNDEKAAPIAIDITAPKVVVSYDNNDVSNEKYFHDTRTATITVTERNFSDDCLNFIVNGGNKKLSFSLKDKGTGNRDNAVWVAHYTFGADQDYKVSVEVQDRAKNKGSVDYTGEAPQEFTIDMIKPEISVAYDNNDVLNELYYKEARTATITIKEHNFSADDVVIELTAKDNGSVINVPSVSSWVGDGDYHRATINYNYDGEFTFDIDFMDLATNEADDYEMDHFIVDLTAPEIEIFDIEDKSANNDVVTPGIRYSDTNYDADGTVVEMLGYNNGLVEMTGSRTVNANGVEFKLKDFEHVPEMDDMYTMNATVYDLAGNSSEASVMFSVNRFGSVYTFDEDTEALVGKDGSYYTSEEQDLVIIETNVDTLEFREITLNLNGKLKTLVEGTDFEVSESGSEETWKQYTYQVAKENFVEEGLYILTIYSEDRATNVSDNNVKGKKIEFVVDKTQPSLLITGVEDGGRYKEDSRELTIDVEDNVSLGYVEVTLNGECTRYEAAEISEMNGKITLTVGSSNQYQTLKVTVVDAAKNEPVTQELTFLVTANVIVQFYMNKPLFFGTIGAIASLSGGLWWFLSRRKKSN